MHVCYNGFSLLRPSVLSPDKERNIQSNCLGVRRENLLTCTFATSLLVGNILGKCSDLMLILL